MTQSITHYDFLLLNYIQSNLHSSFGDFVMPYITMLGNGGAIWIIIAIGFLFFKNFR
ncbi:MAG: hypothetical protein PF518_03520 [Spirochaetaceae bacterium]|jgi:undecaprenyl-diphosphatase|nr:hypothetical protein [Spirochaetaceae bacterium]